MLQVVLGLDARRIASAFLASPAAMAKRLVRAKTKIRQAGIPFAVPEPAELAPRLDAVFEAIYAAFAEGWTDPGGTDPARRELTGEAIFLARVVSALMPGEPEALGLLALMLHAEARRRRGATPPAPTCRWPSRTRAWDWPMIAEAEALLLRASSLGAIGRFQLEAALQSAHVHRRRTGEADWPARAATLRRAARALRLPRRRPQPRARRRRAAWATAGLAALEAAAADPRLAGTSPLGRPRRPARPHRRHRRGPPRLPDRHRPRTRPRGAQLPAGPQAALPDWRHGFWAATLAGRGSARAAAMRAPAAPVAAARAAAPR